MGGWGIIPARAGFTHAAQRLRIVGADHPRSRGVYSASTWTSMPMIGSSPLARGLPDGGVEAAIETRIIPARAGFTKPSPTSLTRSTDHPRSRGVYARRPMSLAARSGIIPARAGFTSWTITRTAAWTDHPRSRGVYGVAPTMTPARKGSSPLARGLHPLTLPMVLSLGIIPARAGFTPATHSPRGACRDHPRSRGVYASRCTPPPPPPGSSPLARGLPGTQTQSWAPAGIIPARAGFTSDCKDPRSIGQDHPRSRGVYVIHVFSERR